MTDDHDPHNRGSGPPGPGGDAGGTPHLGPGFDPRHTGRYDPYDLGEQADAEDVTAAGDALHRLAVDSTDTAALGTLVASDVLVPDVNAPARDNGDARVVKLPIAEQPDGRRFVPIFTSRQRMAAALPTAGPGRRLPLAVLLRMWPSGDLMLAVDPGTEEGITLPAEGVRALAALAD